MSDSSSVFHLSESKLEPTTFCFTAMVEGEEVGKEAIRIDVKGKEVIRIDSEGKIFWNSKEVVTDEEFRCMMKELVQILINMRNDRSDILSC